SDSLHSLHLLSLALGPPPSPLLPYTTLFRSLPPTSRFLTRRSRRDRSLRHTRSRSPSPGASGPPSPRPRDYCRSSRRCCAYCARSEEHTSELQSRFELVCRLLLENKNDQRQP